MNLIKTAEFAEMIQAAPSTVRYWRHIGYGPRSVKVGRRVLYDKAEIEQWITDLRDSQVGGRVA